MKMKLLIKFLVDLTLFPRRRPVPAKDYYTLLVKHRSSGILRQVIAIERSFCVEIRFLPLLPATVTAEIAQNTFGAVGRPCNTGVTAMQNQPVMGVFQKFLRHVLEQFPFNLQWRLAGRKTGAVGNPENVGIDSDRWLTECRVEHDIGSFSAHAGQGLEFRPATRNLAIMFFQQYPAGAHDVGCFGVKQANGSNIVF